jgi:hypothetical protein
VLALLVALLMAVEVKEAILYFQQLRQLVEVVVLDITALELPEVLVVVEVV